MNIKNIIIATGLILLGLVVFYNYYNQNQKAEDVEDKGLEFKDVFDTENNLPENKENNSKPVDSLIVNKSDTLDLSKDGLTKVPVDVFNQKNLKELDLSNNKLEGALPAEIHFLQDLRILNLSNNNFTGVPAEIGQLERLEVLNLANNNLTGLPYELGNLTNLKLLDLRGNDYAKQDLDFIKKSLPNTVNILVD